MRVHSAVTALALATGLIPLSTMADARNIQFSVERDGKPIGTHATTISKRGETTSVTINMSLKAGLFGIPLYRFRYKANETWNGNQLQSLKVSVNDNGDKSNLSGKRSGGSFSWSMNGQNDRANGAVFPTNHWNKAVLKQNKVLNTLTGNINRVTIARRGTETLNCRKGPPIEATRYQYSGGLNTEAWYDRSGNWVGLRFKAEDGATIFFRC